MDEEEDVCFRCDRSKEEVKLVDAVYNNEVVKVCEECSLSENIPVIRKPSSQQLTESEKPYTVRQRMLRMAGIKEDKEEKLKETIRKISDVKIDDLRKKDYKTEAEKKFILAKERNKPISLVDNYNWLILMARKKRKITRHQLAGAIGENELAIKFIENKELPDDALRIIVKIEQYLGVRLRKDDDKILWPRLIKQTQPQLTEKAEGNKQLLENQKKQSFLGPENLKNFRGVGKNEEKSIEKPAVVLKFDPETTKNITIEDLKKMKEARRTAEIESAGRKALDLKKEINASEIVWRAKEQEKKGTEEKDRDLLGSDVEFEE